MKYSDECKRGRRSIFNEDRLGHPIEVTASEMIGKVHDVVINDRGVKLLILWAF